MEEKRPSPDALLKEAEREEKKKGRLKIFIGYSPGVGKTYTMLNEAHVLKSRGVDVIAGVVETHHRDETEMLLSDLEVIPRRRVEYMGIVLGELDLDAVLARRPSVALVDELAHTNVGESRHPKRYQDIEELLDSGIDVYTTVNIQHFESMNDVVAKITGVRMQETLPDSFLDRADEVQVIDIPWEELLQRLKEGKVYFPEQARNAMKNFFQLGNLFALRELMLNLVARKVDSELLNYMRARAISGPWPVSERLVVCIAASPYAKQLVRKAYTIAKDTHAEWYALYVSTVSVTGLSVKERAYLTEALNLAEELGAKVMTLTGTDITNEILRFAREYNMTRIVIGKPLRSMIIGFLKGSPASRLLHSQNEFELHLITPTIEKKETEIQVPSGRLPFSPKEYLLSLVMVALITLVNLFPLQQILNPLSLLFVYLLAPIVCALLYGTGPSLFASIASLLAFDYLFTDPKYSLSMKDPHEMIGAIVFFVTSIVIGQLVKTTRKQNLALQYRLERVSLAEELSKELLTLPPAEQLVEELARCSGDALNVLTLLRTTILNDISQLMIKYVARTLDAPSFVLFKVKEGGLQVWARSTPEVEISQNELAVAEWTYSRGEIAGCGTGTLSSIQYFFMPIKSQDETIGVMGIQYDFKSLLPEQRHLLGTISNLTSLVAARWVKI